MSARRKRRQGVLHITDNHYISGTLRFCHDEVAATPGSPILSGVLHCGEPMRIDVRDNIQSVLAGMKGYSSEVLEKAIPRALNRTAEMARVAASRELRAQGYNLSSAEIKSAIALSKAMRGRLVATMRVRRRTKSLMEFSPTQSKAGVTVKIHGARKLIKGAFIGQLRNGRLGVYVEDKTAGKTVLRRSKQYKRGSRGGWHDYPVRKLYGPSVGGVYSTDKVQRVMLRLIGETFQARLAHEIKYLTR